jgi:hypothetical protein
MISHPLVTAEPGSPAYYSQIREAARAIRKDRKARAAANAPRRSAPDRFVERVTKNPGRGCWEWTGALDRHGYGIVMRDGSIKRTHRYAWELCNGAIPAGMVICHRCDNRKCVRPSHLFIGTQRDNIQDAMRKGRHRMSRGGYRAVTPTVADDSKST